MSNFLKRKSQSLPKLRISEFKSKSQNLVNLFTKQVDNNHESKIRELQLQKLKIQDPEQNHREKLLNILQKSKAMVQENKDKILVAKKFRIQRKKNTGPFLTGLEIYKDQEQRVVEIEQSNIQNQKYDINLGNISSQKSDDLAELRNIIRKASKNLGSYKKQTLNVQKNLLYLVDKYTYPTTLLNRRNIATKISNYNEQV